MNHGKIVQMRRVLTNERIEFAARSFDFAEYGCAQDFN
jgi:hypothetical protein